MLFSNNNPDARNARCSSGTVLSLSHAVLPFHSSFCLDWRVKLLHFIRILPPLISMISSPLQPNVCAFIFVCSSHVLPVLAVFTPVPFNSQRDIHWISYLPFNNPNRSRFTGLNFTSGSACVQHPHQPTTILSACASIQCANIVPFPNASRCKSATTASLWLRHFILGNVFELSAMRFMKLRSWTTLQGSKGTYAWPLFHIQICHFSIHFSGTVPLRHCPSCLSRVRKFLPIQTDRFRSIRS